jgi:hypothetical protein
MTEMSRKEFEKFLMHDTFTAKLATSTVGDKVDSDGWPPMRRLWLRI